MRTSKQSNQSWFDVNKNSQETYKLMEDAGFVDFPYSGFPLFLPIGQKIMKSIGNIIRQEAEKQGFDEIYLPLVQHRNYLEKSGRAQLFGQEFMRLAGKRKDFLLTPTNEEFLVDKMSEGLQSYKQLPLKYFQIADKFRDILKTKCLMRSRQFLMADMCSIDADIVSLRESSQSFEFMADKVFKRLGIGTFRLEKENENYVDYVIPCLDGETKIVIESKEKARYANEGEVNTQKASSVGMYFIFDKLDSFNIDYTDEKGISQPVLLGTYGFGLQRCFHAIVDQNKDNFGINFPSEVRPFDISIIPIDPINQKHITYSLDIYNKVRQAGKKPLLDDRSTFIKDRAVYADFIGTEYKLFIGDSEIREGNVTLKKRGSTKGIKRHLENLFQ